MYSKFWKFLYSRNCSMPMSRYESEYVKSKSLAVTIFVKDIGSFWYNQLKLSRLQKFQSKTSHLQLFPE